MAFLKSIPRSPAWWAARGRASNRRCRRCAPGGVARPVGPTEPHFTSRPTLTDASLGGRGWKAGIGRPSLCHHSEVIQDRDYVRRRSEFTPRAGASSADLWLSTSQRDVSSSPQHGDLLDQVEEVNRPWVGCFMIFMGLGKAPARASQSMPSVKNRLTHHEICENAVPPC